MSKFSKRGCKKIDRQSSPNLAKQGHSIKKINKIKEEENN